jgi:hypothetical protein
LSDSRTKSASEAFINSFGSFPVGYIVGIAILPVSVDWIQTDPLMANIAITGVFAAVSFTRTYFLRRVFERFGLDDNLFHLVSKGIRKIKKRKQIPKLEEVVER